VKRALVAALLLAAAACHRATTSPATVRFYVKDAAHPWHLLAVLPGPKEISLDPTAEVELFTTPPAPHQSVAVEVQMDGKLKELQGAVGDSGQFHSLGKFAAGSLGPGSTSLCAEARDDELLPARWCTTLVVTP
jgi:hypothetical protein